MQAALQAANEAKAKPATPNEVEKPVTIATETKPPTRNQSTGKNPAILDMEFSMKADSGDVQKMLPAVKDSADVKVVPVDTIAPTKDEPAAKSALDTLTNFVAVTPAAVKDSVTKSVAIDADTPKEKVLLNEAAPAPTAERVVAATPNVVKRTPCVEILSRSDIDAAMAANSKLSNADEIATAYASFFKEKCVTTTYLKKICNSLASDVSRYKVLEAAYPFTVDYFAFGELSGLIKDSYYSSKFKSLIQQ